MKTKTATLQAFSLWVLVALPAAALPPCPESVNVAWTNCVGSFVFPDNGGEYDPAVENGKGLDAKGAKTFPDGAKYVGEWKDDMADGDGAVTYPDGSTYVGHLKEDLADGQGTHTAPNGGRYTGEWKDDLPNGRGVINYVNGWEYAGEFKDGLENGQGIMTYDNGGKYLGDWKAGKRHGLAFNLFTNGAASACTYVDDSTEDCTDNSQIDVAPILKSSFVSLSNQLRLEIQNNLNLKMYSNLTLDGVWGRETLFALASFAVFKAKTVDVRSRESADRLIVAVLSSASAPSLDAGNPSSGEVVPVAYGTGFYVSDAGYIITNEHVINGCLEVKVQSNGADYPIVILAQDPQNDLALLKSNITPKAFLALSQSSPYSLQEIVVAGFPFGDRFSSSLKFTQGIVSATSGLGNDYSRIQIDAALQPGNSGGPILDEFGNVVGVAVAKLDLKTILEDYGVIPENTNFGIKASAVRNLMEGNGLDLQAPNTEVLEKVELGKLAADATVFLSCWMTSAEFEKVRQSK